MSTIGMLLDCLGNSPASRYEMLLEGSKQAFEVDSLVFAKGPSLGEPSLLGNTIPDGGLECWATQCHQVSSMTWACSVVEPGC